MTDMGELEKKGLVGAPAECRHLFSVTVPVEEWTPSPVDCPRHLWRGHFLSDVGIMACALGTHPLEVEVTCGVTFLLGHVCHSCAEKIHNAAPTHAQVTGTR